MKYITLLKDINPIARPYEIILTSFMFSSILAIAFTLLIGNWWAGAWCASVHMLFAVYNAGKYVPNGTCGRLPYPFYCLIGLILLPGYLLMIAIKTLLWPTGIYLDDVY